MSAGPAAVPAAAIDEWLIHRGRYVDVTFLLRAGADDHLLTIREGRLLHIVPGPHVMARWTFALVASREAWALFWSANPGPRHRDLMGMVKFKELRLEGDQTVFMRNLLYFKELIAGLNGSILES